MHTFAGHVIASLKDSGVRRLCRRPGPPIP